MPTDCPPEATDEAMPTLAMVRRLVQRFTDLWWHSDHLALDYGPTYSCEEQRLCELRLQTFQDSVATEAKQAPRTAAERQATQERILGAFRTFARVSLGFGEGHLDALLERGLPQVGTLFAQMAKRFDPDISGGDIFQAMRNVWTMNCLQMLVGRPIELTPSVFAYSMLYPYTDNYLDDPGVSVAEKVEFNERFGRRLAGEDALPANALGQKMDQMVRLIESQYSRARNPQVFASLAAIHDAQCKSVRLLRRDASPYEVDVLGISLEKGGASVLADGYLVAGSLSEAQAEYMFGWGAFVQLGDDLQDVEADTRDGLSTVFSQTAARWPLDAVTNRTFRFGHGVREGLDCFNAPSAEPVKQLMQRATSSLVTEAAGSVGHLYTADYVHSLEQHSPYRFSVLKERRKQMAGQSTAITKLVEAFARLDDANAPTPFPLP
jgi:hypothetical protein